MLLLVGEDSPLLDFLSLTAKCSLMSWPHPVDLRRTRSRKWWRILLKRHLGKSLALAIRQGGGQRVVRDGEKAVFSFSAGGWTTEHQVHLPCSPAADGCTGLHCFSLVWVKLSSVETKAIASHQTAIRLLTLRVMNIPYLLQPGLPTCVLHLHVDNW